MKFQVSSTTFNTEQLLRHWGYAPNTNNSDQPNYVRRIRGAQPWPRFHLYLTDRAGAIDCELHLDQKPETRHYQAAKAHNAEYDGPLVVEEINRLKQLL